jgi:hypothetical protein
LGVKYRQRNKQLEVVCTYLSRLSACHGNQTDALHQLPKSQQEFLKNCYKQYNTILSRNYPIINNNEDGEHLKEQSNEAVFSRKLEPEAESMEVAGENNVEALHDEDDIEVSTPMNFYDVENKSKIGPSFIASID